MASDNQLSNQISSWPQINGVVGHNLEEILSTCYLGTITVAIHSNFLFIMLFNKIENNILNFLCIYIVSKEKKVSKQSEGSSTHTLPRRFSGSRFPAVTTGCCKTCEPSDQR